MDQQQKYSVAESTSDNNIQVDCSSEVVYLSNSEKINTVKSNSLLSNEIKPTCIIQSLLLPKSDNQNENSISKSVAVFQKEMTNDYLDQYLIHSEPAEKVDTTGIKKEFSKSDKKIINYIENKEKTENSDCGTKNLIESTVDDFLETSMSEIDMVVCEDEISEQNCIETDRYPLISLNKIGNLQECPWKSDIEIKKEKVEGTKENVKIENSMSVQKVSFQCNVCEHKTCTKEELLKHTKEHVSESDVGFTIKENFHESNENQKLVRKEKSDNLKIKFVVINNSKVSKEKRVRKVLPWLQCNVCNFRTTVKNTLKNHMLVHTSIDNGVKTEEHLNNYNERPRRKILPKISEKASNPDLRDFQETKPIIKLIIPPRVENVKVKEKKYKCSKSDCSYSCNMELTLKTHILKHSNPEPFKCETCTYKCTSKSALNLHIKENHPECLPHKCDICDYVTDMEYRLSVHKVNNHMSSEDYFSCDKCEYVAETRKSLANHMISHCSEKPFKCQECPYAAKQKGHLKIHMENHINKAMGVKPFKCPICPYESASKSALTGHMTSHTGERKFYRCEQCDYSVSSKSALDSHMSKHTGMKPFQCGECGYRTASESYIKIHLKAHKQEKIFRCDSCDYAAKNKSCLSLHASVHSGEKPFKCTFCSHSTSKKSALKVHIRTHTGERPYKCPYCSFSANTKEGVKLHVRTMHTFEKPFKCSICPFAGVRQVDVKNHMRTHTGEKPYKCSLCNYECAFRSAFTCHMKKHDDVLPFNCEFCSYKTARHHSFKLHMRTHTGEKPFKCNYCGYSAIRRRDLMEHMYNHTGERPYQCQLCSYGSIRKRTLTQHMKTHTV